jgi:hypothetical protein
VQLLASKQPNGITRLYRDVVAKLRQIEDALAAKHGNNKSGSGCRFVVVIACLPRRNC